MYLLYINIFQTKCEFVQNIHVYFMCSDERTLPEITSHQLC